MKKQLFYISLVALSCTGCSLSNTISTQVASTPSNTPSVSSPIDSPIASASPLTAIDASAVKDYIINGQGDLPEAKKLMWSPTFLDQVDIPGLYVSYIANGGTLDDIPQFALYMTQNAPISDNWQTLFKQDLSKTYDVTVSRIEPLENDLYQAYIEQDGAEVPFVVVSARTGSFHG